MLSGTLKKMKSFKQIEVARGYKISKTVRNKKTVYRDNKL